MLNYVITVAISAFFVPHYLSVLWEPLSDSPTDVIAGIALVALLIAVNVLVFVFLQGLGTNEQFTSVNKAQNKARIYLNDHLLKQVDLDMKCRRLKSFLKTEVILKPICLSTLKFD
jgi:hypothetical protein